MNSADLFVYDCCLSTLNRAVCGGHRSVFLLLKRGNGFGNTLSVCRVSVGAVGDMTILDFLRCFPDRTSSVLEQTLLLVRLQHAEENTGLRVVVIIVLTEVELRGIAINDQWRLRKVRL